jgi:hypothetical protein
MTVHAHHSIVAAVALAAAALPQGAEPVKLDPAAFTTTIDNQWWPMQPGTRWVYRETDGRSVKRVVVTVTNQTHRVADGVVARVVRDTVTERGRLVEDTNDWYAQDRDGNVWYLGEATKAYKGGKVSTEGSWEAGRDGAQPGVAMPAAPVDGLRYRQEYLADKAEDRAEVLSLDEWVTVPFGRFRGVLMTKDFTPVEFDVLEHKLYARGVGPVMTLDISGGSGREELVSMTRRAR